MGGARWSQCACAPGVRPRYTKMSLIVGRMLRRNILIVSVMRDSKVRRVFMFLFMRFTRI